MASWKVKPRLFAGLVSRVRLSQGQWFGSHEVWLRGLVSIKIIQPGLLKRLVDTEVGILGWIDRS